MAYIEESNSCLAPSKKMLPLPQRAHLDAFKLKLYAIKNTYEIREITQEILQASYTPVFLRQKWKTSNRRFFTFAYPSQVSSEPESRRLVIKSMISFVPKATQASTFVLLRGSSHMDGLPAFLYPETSALLASQSEATFILGTYRGYPNDGYDEYGGAETIDPLYLGRYLKILANKLSITITPSSTYLLGLSRGAMEMFLSLSSFSEMFNYFSKFVSICGLLNPHLSALHNPGWLEKMKRDFQSNGTFLWLEKRNPQSKVHLIASKNSPFLIIQGTSDRRICLEEGLGMMQKLKESGFTQVSYWEIDKGNHLLKNRPEALRKMVEWLEGRC